MHPIKVEMPNDVRQIREVKASKNLITAIDKANRLWVWSASSVGGDCTLKIGSNPSLVPQLRKHRIRHVFLGSSFIFAMGDNIGESPQ